MRKNCRRILFCATIAFFVWFGTVLADKQKLQEEIIRIHVVANSDSPEDQSIKLMVRDAVRNSLEEELANITDMQMARDYLQKKLPYIQQVVNQELEALGCINSANVTLKKELFDRSSNALFALPSGIYESLRITIGSGQGENWWSVLFPATVLSKEENTGILSVFAESKENADRLSDTEIRFWVLDVLGRLENKFFSG